MNVDVTGRKFWALKVSVALLLVLLVMVYSLAFLERQIPAVYTVIGSTLASAIPIYLGVNAYQKKLDAEKKGDV